MAKKLENMKIALVHDFLNQYGGAERVLEVLAGIFPDAPIYTLIHEKEKMHGKFRRSDIRTSFLQKFPKFLRRRHKWLLPLMPTAPETFNLREYDLVISSSSAFAKGIIVKPKTIHICYCHAPMRYSWDWNEKYLMEQRLGNKRKLLARLLLSYIRVWDRVASDRVDHFIANSNTTAERIKKYYGRESSVAYPPVEIPGPGDALQPHASAKEGNETKYFLIVSRLSPYKKIELAIEAVKHLDLPLVVIGEGSRKYRKLLEKMAGPRTKFLGWKSDAETKKYYERCRAFILAGEEDFGLTPVEAMAHGKPVIAFRRGGAAETVIEGRTGEFFDEPSKESLVAAIERFIGKENAFNSDDIRDHAQNFSRERFIDDFKKKVEDIIELAN